MYVKLNNALLVKAFFWFGVIMGVFGFFTETSGQQIYLSTGFYLELSIVSLLASIGLANILKLEK